MDMSFSPRDWPQMRSGSRDSAESRGPEWCELLARLDAARIALDDVGKLNRQGSFSPDSARNIALLETAGNEDDRAVNQGVSGNGNEGVPEGCDQTGDELPGYARD